MSKRMKMESYCVADAIGFGTGEIECLRDELQEWLDNMPESVQGGDKASTLQESIETLGQVDYLSVPECVAESEEDDNADSAGFVGGVRFEIVDVRKKRMSRSMRRDAACAALSGAVDAMRSVVEETASEEGKDDPYSETRDEIESLCDELENLVNDVEGAEFPGMYG